MLRRQLIDQLILTGKPENVQVLLDKAVSQGNALNRSRSVQVAHKGQGMQIGLVGGTNSPEMVNRLISLARTNRLQVSVETNCTTGNPFSQELNPWDWEVSPWDWEVSPWDWEVSPSTAVRVISAGATPLEGELLFWKQPAFRQMGLTTADGQRIAALEAHQGEGVLVAAFDALPTAPVNQPWLTMHPAAQPVINPIEGVTRDLSDHGLFTASLIHAVAPKAEVHLYEVCSSEGYGSLFPLLEALAAFIDLAAGRPAVISLSLGSMCANGSSPALQALLARATDLGMVVVAAAGNRGKSGRKVCTVPQAQLPAAFDQVIAVAACNLAGQRATFSQRGDIAAYGGEDVGAPGPGDAEDVIGMGVSIPAGVASGYVAMDGGTSFSTPLVSGAAALVLGDRLKQGVALAADTYSQVLATLQAGTQRPEACEGETKESTGLGAGILYLPSIWA